MYRYQSRIIPNIWQVVNICSWRSSLKTLDEFLKNPRMRGIALFILDHDDSVSEISGHTRYTRAHLYDVIKQMEKYGLVEKKPVIGKKGKYNTYQTTEIGKLYLKTKGYKMQAIPKDLRTFLSEVRERGTLVGVNRPNG